MQLGIEKLFATVPTSHREKVISPILAFWGVHLASGADDDVAKAIGIVCAKVWPVVRSLVIEHDATAPQAVVASPLCDEPDLKLEPFKEPEDSDEDEDAPATTAPARPPAV